MSQPSSCSFLQLSLILCNCSDRCVLRSYVLWYPFDEADKTTRSRFRLSFDE